MSDPNQIFAQWFADAKEAIPAPFDPTAMTLATSTRMGVPSARIVLLKHHDERGFVFYTNLESRKSLELRDNPHAALCFYLGARQVRITGTVEAVSTQEADEYFASRPLMSRIGAWASAQSHPLDRRETLVHKVKELQHRYSESNPPPRPPHWSGWRLVPQTMEFWQEAPSRLHERELYTRAAYGWDMQLLYP
jgi:pyridoxamine 5'-phosphate oxidase